MSTPHNNAETGQIAETVIMPGDPLRAKYIVDTFLENAECFNTVRNMYGYTGFYTGKRVSVMGSGMGMPSMAIYSYELYKFYGVENIIRVGSAGALQDDMNLRDVVIAMGACTDSNYAEQYKLNGTFAPIADYDLLTAVVESARKYEMKVRVGNVLSSDVFYNDDNSVNDSWRKMGVMAVDMEAAALYMNAARLGKKALTVLTISDHLYKTDEKLSAMERQNGFENMIRMTLEAVRGL